MKYAPRQNQNQWLNSNLKIEPVWNRFSKRLDPKKPITNMALVLGSELVLKGSLLAIKKIQAGSVVVALARTVVVPLLVALLLRGTL